VEVESRWLYTRKIQMNYNWASVSLSLLEILYVF